MNDKTNSKKDYVIEVYGLPTTTWLGVPSDEDDDGTTPPLTTDPLMAGRYPDHSEARKACKAATDKYRGHSFRVGVLEPAPVDDGRAERLNEFRANYCKIARERNSAYPQPAASPAPASAQEGQGGLVDEIAIELESSHLNIGRLQSLLRRARAILARQTAPTVGSVPEADRKMIVRAIIGLRDGWATRKDANDALAALAAAPQEQAADRADCTYPNCSCIGGGVFKPCVKASRAAVPEGFVLVPKELTAENGAKAALIGEFSEAIQMNCPDCDDSDEDCESCATCEGSGSVSHVVPIGWSSIKAIYARAVETLAAAPVAQEGKALWSYNIAPPQGFIDYVRKNYSGEVVFHDPEWHALRLWNAAMRNAKPPFVQQEGKAVEGGQDLTLENAPLGTKAPAIMGGYWIRVENGWKWCTGSTFPRPGGDWNGTLIPPAQQDAAPATKPCTMRMSQGADVVEVTGSGDGQQTSAQVDTPEGGA